MDPEFNSDKSESYYLMILPSGMHLSFAVFDPATNRFLLLKAFDTGTAFPNLDTICAKSEELGLRYKKSILLHESKNFSLVPEVLYDPIRSDTIFHYANKLNTGEVIRTTRLNQLHAYLQFPLLLKKSSHFRKHILINEEMHPAAPLIETSLRHYKGEQSRLVHVDISDSIIYVIVKEKDTIIYFNIFPVNTEEDILYYLLFASEQLGINAHETPFYFSGHIYKSSTLFQLLSAYIKETRIMSNPAFFEFGKIFSNIPVHRYNNLFGSVLCVS